MWAYACILMLAEATTMTSSTAMTMEAMLEAQMVASHNARLKEFGLSYTEPPVVSSHQPQIFLLTFEPSCRAVG